MRRSVSVRPAALLLLLALCGCGGVPSQPDRVGEIAVFGYLYVGETVDTTNAIVVRRVGPADHYYDRDEAEVRDALVILEPFQAAPETLTMFRPGHYAAPNLRIEPTTSYALTVKVGDAVLTATTVTPNSIRIPRGPAPYPQPMVHDEIADSYPILLLCDDPRQITLVDVWCAEEDYRNARWVHKIGTSDHPSDYQEYGGDNGPPRHISAWFRLEELDLRGSSYEIDFYGAMMAFYGEYIVGVFSIDENYYNYLYRDNPEHNGGVQGGIGVFGSACRRQWRVLTIE
jgi:hypothetical protein